MTLNSAHVIPVLPVPAVKGTTTNVFLAPCDNNGHITHFVLATTSSMSDEPLALATSSIYLTSDKVSNKAMKNDFAYIYTV